MTEHTSDCALHNAPALPAGPCDCEGGLSSGLTRLVRVGRAHVRLQDDGLEADLEVADGEFMQPGHSPVTLYAVVPNEDGAVIDHTYRSKLIEECETLLRNAAKMDAHPVVPIGAKTLLALLTGRPQ